MSDLKFACPACGQHFACDSSYVGQQITCPSCQASVSVPPAASSPPLPAVGSETPGPSSLRLAAAVGAPPATPPSAAVGRSPAKTSGLAVASLVCSCAGLLLGFLGTIPGIVIGFKALRQIKTNPALRGKGLATAGLVTGFCLTLVWIPLAFILAVATLSGFRAVKALEARTTPVQRTAQASEPEVATDLAPDGSGWVPDLEGVSIPDTPVAGRLGGIPFSPIDVTLHGEPASDLEFLQQISTPTREDLFDLYIEIGQQDAAKYSGRTLTVRKDGAVAVQPPQGWDERAPTFRMVWSDPGTKPFRERVHDLDQSWPCAMRLEFGQLKDGKIPGRIYLCIFDRNKSFIRGKFVATVSQSTPIGAGGNTPLSQLRPDAPPTNTDPDSAGWTLDLSSSIIPDLPATGRVHGVPFKMDRATIEGPMIKLRQGLGFFADREFDILILEAAGDPSKLGNRTIEVLPGDTSRKPDVRVSWMEPGRGVPESIGANVYAMKLELEEIKNGKLSGRVYLCVADHEKSFVRGKFTASLPQWTIPATPPPHFPRRPPPRPGR